VTQRSPAPIIRRTVKRFRFGCAARIRGDAPADLLDSYFAERHPEGARILDWSRAQVALMRPTPSTRALEAVIRDLVGTRDGATYFAEKLWGVSLRYDLGGAHPLVGRSVPDFALASGTRTGQLLRGGGGLLLDFAPGAAAGVREALAGTDRLRFERCRESFRLNAVLVRELLADSLSRFERLREAETAA
jgi:hypothetical protein